MKKEEVEKMEDEKLPAEPYYMIKGSIKLLKDVINPKDIWQTSSGVKIISLSGLQKIAQKESIAEKRFQVDITPNENNKQQHVVNIWLGFKGDSDTDNWVRGSGEASVLNTGKVEKKLNSNTGNYDYSYIERSEIDSQYRFAMADKRAYSRALIKLIGLIGVYCEVEAQAFSKSNKDYSGEKGQYDNL
jgi:hypothetical protein